MGDYSEDRRSDAPGAREERPVESEDAKLFIGNLSYDVTERDLESEFGKYGKVASVRIITDRETNRPRGFGFVTFEDERDAADAITGLDGKDLCGREIRVNKSTPKGQGPARGAGGYGDRGEGGGYGDRGGRGGGYSDRGGGGGYGDRGGGGGYGDRGDRGGYGGDRGGYGGDRDRDRGGGGGGYRGDDRRGGGGGGGGGPCYGFQRGDCRFGDSCRYSHDGAPGGGGGGGGREGGRESDRGGRW